MEIYIASHNPHKKREIQPVLPANYRLLDLNDLGDFEPIEETGQTLEENALIKAKQLYKRLQKPCIADDSGLEVRALKGAPGVYSARYAGPAKNDLANMKLLLARLSEENDRSAQFRTVIAYIDADAKEFLFEGIVEGHIAHSIRGSQGFGYDPLFIPLGYENTFGELDPEIKHQISHRTLAIEKWVKQLIKNKNQ